LSGFKSSISSFAFEFQFKLILRVNSQFLIEFAHAKVKNFEGFDSNDFYRFTLLKSLFELEIIFTGIKFSLSKSIIFIALIYQSSWKLV